MQDNGKQADERYNAQKARGEALMERWGTYDLAHDLSSTIERVRAEVVK